MKALPLSLYVHFPWCVRKCPYCDFNSHTAGANVPLERYVDALLIDLEQEARRAAGRSVSSIFLGGGTPSLFPAEAIGRVLDAAREGLALTDDVEITLEANPGAVECGSLGGYHAAGVNRLSIGAQSFADASLARLGRIHGSDDIRRSVGDAVASGFDNFNLDLMHGLPGQTVDTALADIDAAVELAPAHISWYQLTLEPNTVFHLRPPAGLPDEDALAQIQDAGAERLTEAGYEQYEVSAWSRPGRRCRHNLNYWLFGDYLAIGAGAHGKLSTPAGAGRYRKPANPRQYMHSIEAGGTAAPLQPVQGADLPFEFMLNALRLVDGFHEADFCERTGLGAARLETLMDRPVARGLIERLDSGTWRPTPLGQRFLNDLQRSFLRDS
ncbi:MAG: radical SAM family heme chaperone HemW [Gammaproteobacteria bacterium]|nr:radical SAM family heme chaperone HemW [Gammaproteobacteria bacterium]